MFNNSFQQTEEFAYCNFTQNCCLRFRWAFGCLRLSCACRLVNPVPFPSSGICLYWVCVEYLVQQLLNGRLCKSAIVILNTYCSKCAVLQIGRSLVRSQLVSVDFSLTQNPSDRTIALGSTQPLTEMSARGISWW